MHAPSSAVSLCILITLFNAQENIADFLETGRPESVLPMISTKVIVTRWGARHQSRIGVFRVEGLGRSDGQPVESMNGSFFVRLVHHHANSA